MGALSDKQRRLIRTTNLQTTVFVSHLLRRFASSAMRDTSILESLTSDQLQSRYTDVSDRYYEHKYCLEISPEIRDVHQRVSFHSNRICMISLAEHHPIIANRKRVSKIDCSIDEKTDRLKNAASGKGKRGAQKLEAGSLLCSLECDDGTVYPVYSCVKGKLIEMNESLLKQPHLLVEKPVSEGFIALLLPVLNTFDQMKSSMLSCEEYLRRVQE